MGVSVIIPTYGNNYVWSIELASFAIYASMAAVAIFVFLAFVAVGIPGNILSIIGLRSCGQIPISGYLIGMSVCDLLSLALTGSILCCSFFLDVDLHVVNGLSCPVLSFLEKTSLFSGTWILVAMLLDRMFSDMCHSRLQRFSTKRRSKTVCLTIVVISVLLHSPNLLFGETTSIPSYLNNGVNITSTETYRHCQLAGRFRDILQLFEIHLYFLLEVAVPIVTVDIVLLKLVKSCLNGRDSPESMDLRLNTATILIGALYLISNLPCFMLILHEMGVFEIDGLMPFTFFFQLMTYFGKSVNPFVYLLFREFRYVIGFRISSLCGRKTRSGVHQSEDEQGNREMTQSVSEKT